MHRQGLETKKLCNFRTQTLDDWQDWQWFKHFCHANGITTCRPLIAFIRSFRRGMDGLKEGLERKQKREVLNAFPLIIALEQQNTFVYSVEKPRRQPTSEQLFFKDNFRTATMSTRLRFSYILEKSQHLFKHGQKSFCFKDFAEIKHHHFRKLMVRLRKSGHIVTVEPRTCPRFYMLTSPPRTTE